MRNSEAGHFCTAATTDERHTCCVGAPGRWLKRGALSPQHASCHSFGQQTSIARCSAVPGVGREEEHEPGPCP